MNHRARVTSPCPAMTSWRGGQGSRAEEGGGGRPAVPREEPVPGGRSGGAGRCGRGPGGAGGGGEEDGGPVNKEAPCAVRGAPVDIRGRRGVGGTASPRLFFAGPSWLHRQG